MAGIPTRLDTCMMLSALTMPSEVGPSGITPMLLTSMCSVRGLVDSPCSIAGISLKLCTPSITPSKDPGGVNTNETKHVYYITCHVPDYTK